MIGYGLLKLIAKRQEINFVIVNYLQVEILGTEDGFKGPFCNSNNFFS